MSQEKKINVKSIQNKKKLLQMKKGKNNLTKRPSQGRPVSSSTETEASDYISKSETLSETFSNDDEGNSEVVLQSCKSDITIKKE
jgi:hypothetical protein